MVMALAVADGAGPRAHDKGVRRRAAAAVPHAFEKLSVGYAGGDEEDVVPSDQVVCAENAVEVVARIDRALAFLVVLRPEFALDDAAHALDGCGADDPFRRATDTEQQVDTGAFTRSHDRTGNITIADELDPR